jgi:hypothetical protein
VVEGGPTTAIGATTAGVGALRPGDMALSLSKESDGKSHIPKVESSGRSEPIERQVNAAEIRNSFVKLKEMPGELNKVGERAGRTTWHDKKHSYRTIREKEEIDVYHRKRQHIRVGKPNDGVLRKDLTIKRRPKEK